MLFSDTLIRRTARRMFDDGYLNAGYEYIILGDCWSELSRDNVTKRLIADRKRFPSGMKDLADYVSNDYYKSFISVYHPIYIHTQKRTKVKNHFDLEILHIYFCHPFDHCTIITLFPNNENIILSCDLCHMYCDGRHKNIY